MVEKTKKPDIDIEINEYKVEEPLPDFDINKSTIVWFLTIPLILLLYAVLYFSGIALPKYLSLESIFFIVVVSFIIYWEYQHIKIPNKNPKQIFIGIFGGFFIVFAINFYIWNFIF